MKYFLMIVLILLILGCGSQPETSKAEKNPLSMPYPSSSLSSHSGIYLSPSTTPLILITPTPNPYNNLEVYRTWREQWWFNKNLECNAYCEDPKDTKIELLDISKIADIAVSKDGNMIYMINKREEPVLIGDNKYVPIINSNRPQVFDISINKITNVCWEIIKRGCIYTLNKNKEINILKINNIPLLTCNIGKELEIDSKNNIYIADPPNLRIYKTNNTTITKVIEINEKPEKPTNMMSGDYIGEAPKFQINNLYVYNNDLYFILENPYQDGISFIKKLDYTVYKIRTSGIAEIIGEEVIKLPLSVTLNIPPIGAYYAIYIGLWQINDNYLYPSFREPPSGFFFGPTPKPIKYENLIVNLEEYKKIIPYKTKINSKGEMYITDIKAHCIWKIIPYKELTMFAGNGQAGFKDGKGQEAQFNTPTAIDIDGQDNIYIIDSGNKAIRKITHDGEVTTFYAQTSPERISN